MEIVLSEKVLDINLKHLIPTENAKIRCNTANKDRIKLNGNCNMGKASLIQKKTNYCQTVP